jgi:hypothetical protein
VRHLNVPHISKSGSLVLVVVAIVSDVEVGIEGVRTGIEVVLISEIFKCRIV